MNMPVFRFELKGMRHTLLTHLGKYNDDLERMVDESAKKVIEEFDFDSVIRKGMEEALAIEIRQFFQYGDGRKLIRAALKVVLDEEKDG